jgi:hypothetical protein
MLIGIPAVAPPSPAAGLHTSPPSTPAGKLGGGFGFSNASAPSVTSPGSKSFKPLLDWDLHLLLK